MKNKPVSDRIFIRGLTVSTIIGIWPEEQQNPQQLILDLDFESLIDKAAASDAIADALDYAKITRYLSDYIPTTRFNLIEALAEDLAQKLFENFPIESLSLTLYKKPFDIKNVDSVGLIIERRRTLSH